MYIFLFLIDSVISINSNKLLSQHFHVFLLVLAKHFSHCNKLLNCRLEKQKKKLFMLVKLKTHFSTRFSLPVVLQELAILLDEKHKFDAR